MILKPDTASRINTKKLLLAKTDTFYDFRDGYQIGAMIFVTLDSNAKADLLSNLNFD